MPALDQLPDRTTARQSVTVLEGVLTDRRGQRWAIIDGAQALLGPLRGADELAAGARVVVAITQLGTPVVVAAI